MAPRASAVVLLVAGVLLFLVALTADSLGIGSQAGLGYKQVAAAVVGIVVAALGMLGLRTPRR